MRCFIYMLFLMVLTVGCSNDDTVTSTIDIDSTTDTLVEFSNETPVTGPIISWGTDPSDSSSSTSKYEDALKWEKLYSGIGNTIIYGVTSVLDGGYVFSGVTGLIVDSASNSHSHNGILLAKIDENGNEIWEKNIKESTGLCMGNQVSATNDSGFVISTSQFQSSKNNEFPYISPSEIIMKMDRNGEVEWENESDVAIKKVIQLPTGYYYGVGINTNYLNKWDRNGDSIAFVNLRLSEPYSSTSFNDILSVSDSNYIIAGLKNYYWQPSVAVSKRSSHDSEWLQIYDIKELYKYYTEIMYFQMSSINKTTDGGYILSGNSNVYSNFSDLSNSAWCMKINESGDQEWLLELENYNVGADIALDAVEVENGYIIVGSTYNFHDIVFYSDITAKDKIPKGSICKVSPFGVVGWRHENDSVIYTSVEKTPDGGCVVVGEKRNADGTISAWVGKIKK